MKTKEACAACLKSMLIVAMSPLVTVVCVAQPCASAAVTPPRAAEMQAKTTVAAGTEGRPQVQSRKHALRRGSGHKQSGRKAGSEKTFDMKELIARLKETQAIGFFTKLAIRSDALDLVAMVKAYRRHAAAYSLRELRARFDGLLLKVLALLNGDPKLARDIYLARECIWKSLLEVKA